MLIPDIGSGILDWLGPHNIKHVFEGQSILRVIQWWSSC